MIQPRNGYNQIVHWIADFSRRS